ncbi:MAG: serine/threonine protein kinase, partial [Planctomycetes bacterium]|nr:serine/threonine protein kinase [Planctomycetota bacterium]
MNICLSCEGVTAAATPRCGHCGAFLLPLESVHYPTRRGEADAGNPLLGSIVDGKYRLDGVLGRGGLGTVFQAEHTGSLMKVAVKLLHPRFSERAEYRKALLPEARRAATVTNERCARLLDVGDTADGGTYLAMELVDGDTLDTLVANGPLAPAHAVDILVQIAEALVAIHAAGLVHCDLAPRNVMVSTRGGALVAKVLDFGIARSISITSGDRREHGEFAGFANAAFSAPEQLAGRDVDPRADLYSLGALGWFLLTGKAPIDDRDAARAARAAIAGELESWPGVPGAPRRLQRLIAACLRLDPEARPPSAAAVRRELLAIRGARRPALARTAVTMLALAVVFAVAAFVETATPFLRSVGGSPLLLRERPQQQPRHLTSRELATLQLRFGGFRVDQLRLDVARAGSLLWQKALHPAVGGGGDMLTLSVAQPEWQQVVRSLVEASREDAVDLSFVVPGRAPLGSARVRVDDDAPQLEAAFADPTATTLTAAAILDWRATDAVGITRLAAFVTLEGGGDFEFDLIGSGGSFSLGRRLAERVETVSTLRGGEVRLEATDFAGNVAQLEVARFAACDVHAPSVRAVTGPAGEPFLPSVGGKLRLRIELSSPERGCELAIRDLDDRERLRRPLDGGAFQDFEIATTDLPSASGQYVFAVTDAAGNVAVAKHACPIRDRAIRLQFVGDAPSCVTVGDELVIGSGGAELALRCSEAYDVTRLGVLPGRAGAAPTAAEVR